MKANVSALEYFLGRDDISALQKIDALELAGATLMLKKDDADSVAQAFEYWNRATDLRDGQETTLSKVPLNDNRIVHWRTVEWTTKDQLRELQRFPSERKLQALMVLLRIGSEISSDALTKFEPILEVYWEKLKVVNQRTKLLEVCWITLEAFGRKKGLQKNDLRMIDEFTYRLISAIKDLKEERNPILTPEILRVSLESVSTVYLNTLDGGYYRMRISFSIGQLVSILAHIPEMMTREMMCCLHKMVGCNNRKDYYCLLFTICRMFPSFDDLRVIVRLLLKAGADPNTTDEYGNNALHILAGTSTWFLNDGAKARLNQLIEELIDRGAHLDQVNKLQETPKDVWKKNNGTIKSFGKEREMQLPPTWIKTNIPPLTCLSARTIALNGILYDETTLPITLHAFVAMHQ